MKRLVPLLAITLIGCGWTLASVAPAQRQAAGARPTGTVDVRDFGAIPGDGEDDTAAIRNALQAIPERGGTLYLSTGDYLISSPLVIPRGDLDVDCDNARFVINGPDVQVLAFHGELSPGGTARNISVSGCGFFDPDPQAHVDLEESHGIVLINVAGAVLRDLSFDSMGDESVDIIFSTNIRLLDSTVVNGCAAVSVDFVGSFSINNSSRVQIRGNTIEANANGSAIRVEVTGTGRAADHVIIADNLIFDSQDLGNLGGNSGVGIVVNPARGHSRAITITGNQIVNPYRSGITINPVQSGSVSNVIVSDNLILGGGSGATVWPSLLHGAIDVSGRVTTGAVVANVIDGWGTNREFHAGIRIEEGGFAVNSNVVRNVPGYAVVLQERDRKSGGNAVVGTVGSGTRGVKAAAKNLVALNKMDGSGGIVLPGLRGCQIVSTDGNGLVWCAQPLVGDAAQTIDPQDSPSHHPPGSVSATTRRKPAED